MSCQRPGGAGCSSAPVSEHESQIGKRFKSPALVCSVHLLWGTEKSNSVLCD